MLSLVQRVTEAQVRVSGTMVGAIGAGLLVFLCAERGDTPDEAQRMLAKLLRLRVFADHAGKMNRSLQEVAGGLLVVSQFTLAADTTSGNRPGLGHAAPPDQGRRLYDHFVALARVGHPVVATGIFGADMQVSLVNDGPVTIPLRIVPAPAKA